MGIATDLADLKELSDGVVANKVSRFAYTEQAYINNEVNGVIDYDVNRGRNIPVGTASVMKVNQTVIEKGYRARGSSITRMLLNHFLGRLSYNVNKVNDWFNTLLLNLSASLGTPNGIATLDGNTTLPVSQVPFEVLSRVAPLGSKCEIHKVFDVYDVANTCFHLKKVHNLYVITYNLPNSGGELSQVSTDMVTFTYPTVTIGGTEKQLSLKALDYNPILQMYIGVIRYSGQGQSYDLYMGYSTDGVHWTKTALSVYDSSACDVVHNEQGIELVGRSYSHTVGTGVQRSVDGINYQSVSIPSSVSNGAFKVVQNLAGKILLVVKTYDSSTQVAQISVLQPSDDLASRSVIYQTATFTANDIYINSALFGDVLVVHSNGVLLLFLDVSNPASVSVLRQQTQDVPSCYTNVSRGYAGGGFIVSPDEKFVYFVGGTTDSTSESSKNYQVTTDGYGRPALTQVQYIAMIKTKTGYLDPRRLAYTQDEGVSWKPMALRPWPSANPNLMYAGYISLTDLVVRYAFTDTIVVDENEIYLVSGGHTGYNILWKSDLETCLS